MPLILSGSSGLSGNVGTTTKDMLPAGTVLQVVNFYSTTPTVQSIPSTQVPQNVADIAVTITPFSANSKFYITAHWFGEPSVSVAAWSSMFGLSRNGTQIGLPPANGTNTLGITPPVISYYADDNDSTGDSVFFDYYDSPNTTSPLTYRLTYSSNYAPSLYTNRNVAATANAGYERGTSSITVMEIKG